MFEQDNFHRTGMRFSGNQAVTLLLTILSLAAGIYILLNLSQITTKIAVGIANLLTAGVPILIFILVTALFFSQIGRKSR